MGIFWYHNFLWHFFFLNRPNGPPNGIMRYLHDPLCCKHRPQSQTWRTLLDPYWILEDEIIQNIIYHQNMWFSTCVPIFICLAWFEMCEKLPVLEVIHGGHWWFLTGVLVYGVILDIMNNHDMWFFIFVSNFSSS